MTTVPKFEFPTIYVKIDESGTPGKRQTGKTHYIMAGCLVNNPSKFEQVTRSYYHGKELKFYTHKTLRIPVILDAFEYVDLVYFVQFCKPMGWDPKKSKTEDVIYLHKSLLQSLARGISQENPNSVINIVIDHTELISDVEAQEIVSAQSGDNVIMSPTVEDSKDDFGLMTNDFFVGAIGYRYNTPYNKEEPRKEYAYTDLFVRKIKELPYREFSEILKSEGKKNTGNPSRHLSATAWATQTSCGLQTTSPSKESLGSPTNTFTSPTNYKIVESRRYFKTKKIINPTKLIFKSSTIIIKGKDKTTMTRKNREGQD